MAAAFPKQMGVGHVLSHVVGGVLILCGVAIGTLRDLGDVNVREVGNRGNQTFSLLCFETMLLLDASRGRRAKF